MSIIKRFLHNRKKKEIQESICRFEEAIKASELYVSTMQNCYAIKIKRSIKDAKKLLENKKLELIELGESK